MNKKYQLKLYFVESDSFAQVVYWLRQFKTREVNLFIKDALIAFYYPFAVRTQFSIWLARKHLEQRLFDLAELERSLGTAVQSSIPSNEMEVPVDDFEEAEPTPISVGSGAIEDNF